MAFDELVTTTEAVAEQLQSATAFAQPIVPWGNGTRQHIGAAPVPGAQRLDLAGLNRVVAHVPADMTVTVQAGMTLGALQRHLAEHRQWLPWDPPQAENATVGGLLASAASGPWRLGYGTPRDWVLGMRVVLGDGRIVKSGGNVVKNVAGYDSHKLHIGALGTLGIITEATFKAFPLPDDVATRTWVLPTADAALALAEQLRAAPLSPASLLLLAPTADDLLPSDLGDGHWMLCVRYVGTAAGVARQCNLAETAATSARAEPIALTDPAALWQRAADWITSAADRCVLRVGTVPTALGRAIAAATRRFAAAPLVALPAVGLLHLRPAAHSFDSNALAALRTDLAASNGYVAVEDAPDALHATLDLRGAPPPTLPIMRALKRQWDPADLLNRGRYLV